MNHISICIINGGYYDLISKIDDKEIEDFESEEDIVTYITERDYIKVYPVSDYTSTVIFTKSITSINFK